MMGDTQATVTLPDKTKPQPPGVDDADDATQRGIAEPIGHVAKASRPAVPTLWQERRKLIGLSYLFTILCTSLVYFVLTIFADIAKLKTTFFAAALGEAISWPGVLGVPAVGMVVPFLLYLLYQTCLRKRMLVRHRLYLLAGQLRSGSGLGELVFPAILCLIVACVLAVQNCKEASCSPAVMLAINILVISCALSLSVWLLHLVDYASVSQLLSANHLDHLVKTVGWLSEATIGRLVKTTDFRKKYAHQPQSPEDDLPDREIGPDILETLLENLRKRLEKFQDDNAFIALSRRLGNVVALFHPDYLPHLAHVYLKISQLRALNMAPRRIQLLGRRWTVRGLESEYVVVHDISELRPEYVEWSAVENNVERIVELRKRLAEADDEPAAERLSTSSVPDDLMGKIVELSQRLKDVGHQPAAKSLPPSLVSADLMGQIMESKWRQRSLKKRAIVTVAPDGSLLSISIEEERQFNI